MKPITRRTLLKWLALGTVFPSSLSCALPKPTRTPIITPKPSATPQEVIVVEDPVGGYLALAPRTLHAGQTQAISVSLFKGQAASAPANANVRVALVGRDGRRVAEAAGPIHGRGEIPLQVPKVPEGDYEIQVSGKDFAAKSPIRVEDGTLLFIETDKPIYKPGQVVHFRLLTLDAQLRPVAGQGTLEVIDAKGIKIFKKDMQTDDFGLAGVDLPLSTEPNLGVWKATFRAGKPFDAAQGRRKAQLDLRVERYVLPKYEVKVELAKEWVLANEPIKGTIRGEYSYGKPVKGEVQIVATRYVGTWQEFANITRALDGQVDFQLPAPGYVAGVPGAKGMGNVSLEVTLREKATGYEEKTTRLITVAPAPVVLSVIPESVTFKPSLPLSLLVIAETPDKKPADANVTLEVAYTSSAGKDNVRTSQETRQVSVRGGKALLKLTPPAEALSLSLYARARDAYTSLAMQAGYSPTGSFIHVEQVSEGALRVGDTARFKVSSTKEARNFYYEVLARGRVVFSEVSRGPDIELTLTPQMAPESRLLVYQVLPTSEVAADYLPFSVSGEYPQKVQSAFSKEEVRPGDPVDISVQTEGPARVGLAVVDRSVFILAENRLNLQQVFAELERLYQKPQVELHEATPLGKITTWGANEVFRDAGLVVLSNQKVPAGKEYDLPMLFMERAAGGVARDLGAPRAAVPAPMPTQAAAAKAAEGQAEVQRVRQFFPETWLWLDLTTDGAGRASKRVEAPDSITTWMLRAVALSKEKGLGMAEAQLRVLQPFFLSVDLPYAAIRGEQFPVRVALYNYTPERQEFTVELEGANWFDLTGEARKTVAIGPNDIGGADFTISPQQLGTQKLQVTARSKLAADAVIKEIIIEPEGVARELVENLIVAAGSSKEIDTTVPPNVIAGSARAYLGLTGSYLTQAIEGLEGLLQMPFGCGEQNMILFAPNVFVARYLRETNQMKPEVMAKAESLMMTGYQRELIYRRNDGSFSAFGNQDKEGSLWLTAFVLKTFAQARDLMYIDEAVLDTAKAWIVKHQKADGSFEPVGFVHHQEMLGGVQGKTALTAYVAVALRESSGQALREAGESDAATRAVRYLENELARSEDTYALGLGAYALELAKSPRAAAVYERLMAKAKEADGGLYWGDKPVVRPVDEQGQPARRPMMPRENKSAAVETTGYALMALLEHVDQLNAGRAARWLVSQRNAYGGYGSTQDTVVGLQALTRFAAGSKADVDATVTLRSGSFQKQLRVGPENVDVLQMIDVPTGGQVTVEVQGKGQVVLQAVRRFNIPEPEERQPAFQIDVKYGVDQVAVNDLITIDTRVRFTPPEPLQAGMVVVDVAVPTGFAPEAESVEAAVKKTPKMKRFEMAGRKVVFYIEDMMPEEEIRFSFQARALYPVKAQAVTSQVYAYYRPELKGESLGGALRVK